MFRRKKETLAQYQVLGAIIALDDFNEEELAEYSIVPISLIGPIVTKFSHYLIGRNPSSLRYLLRPTKREQALQELRRRYPLLPLSSLWRKPPEIPMVLLMAENFAYQVFYESSLEKRAEILARARYYLGRAQQACQRLENMSSKLPVFVAIINLRLKWVTKHLELLEQWHLQNMKAYVLESKTDITWAECEQAREDPAIPRFILAYMSESVRYREKTGKAISPGQLMERDKIRIDQCRYPTNDCLRPHEQNNFLETGQLNAEQQHHLENCHACYALLAASYQLRHKSEELPAVLANISISNPNKSA